MVHLTSLTSLLALTGSLLLAPLANAATAKTTRYWDCCKPSCSWAGKASVSEPVRTCNRDDQLLSNANAASGCGGGEAYTCSDNSPWAVSDTLAYGFAAAKLAGKAEGDWCCACYKLRFTSQAVSGKEMIVQVTNTGGDLGENHFDLMMPGGGMGLFTDGCANQWGSGIDFGAQYGGFGSSSMCEQLPEQWREGCKWRFDWFGNSDNPEAEFEEVTCPKEIVDKTGCGRSG